MFEFGALVGVVSQKRLHFSTCFVIAGQIIHSGKFKHLQDSENVNFEKTSNVVSILVTSYDGKTHGRTEGQTGMEVEIVI